MVNRLVAYQWIAGEKPKSTPAECKAILSSLDPAQIPAIESFGFPVRKGITDRVITVIKRALPYLAADQISQKQLAKKINIPEKDISRVIIKLAKAGYQNEQFKICIAFTRAAVASASKTRKRAYSKKDIINKIQKELIKSNGELANTKKFAEKLGIHYSSLRWYIKRLNSGMSIDDIVAGKRGAKNPEKKTFFNSRGLVEKFQLRLPELEERAVRKKALGATLGISQPNQTMLLSKLKNGDSVDEIITQKKYVPITKEIVEKIQSRIAKEEPAEGTLSDFATELHISRTNLAVIIKKLKNGGNMVVLMGPPIHAIYCKLTPPYEIQDVNYPGCVDLRTDDLEEFKLFLLFWQASYNQSTWYANVQRVLHIADY